MTHPEDRDPFRPTEPPVMPGAARDRMLATVRAGLDAPGAPVPSTRAPWTVLLAAAAAVVVLAGGTIGVARLVQDGPTPVAAPVETTSSAAPTTTSGAPSSSATPPVTPTTTPSSTPAVTTPAPADLGGPAPGFPPEFTDFALNGYEELWAVYVAVGEPGDPALVAARERLDALGYRGTSGELGCDRGAPEALGVDGSLFAEGVYFTSREQAGVFAAAWDGAVAGTALVTIGCNDGAEPGPEQGPVAGGFPAPRSTPMRTGDQASAVFLAVSTDPADSRLTAAADSVRGLGYVPVERLQGCDAGVVETLGLDPTKTYSATYLYFDTAAAAQQFVAAYEPGVVGTVAVTWTCADSN